MTIMNEEENSKKKNKQEEQCEGSEPPRTTHTQIRRSEVKVPGTESRLGGSPQNTAQSDRKS